MMKRTTMTLGAALLFATGCSHSRSVAKNDSDMREATSARSEQRRESTSPHAEHKAKTRDADGVERDEQGRREIPVATSANGLLKPGAEKQIEQRLADEGFLHRKDEGETGGPRATASTTEALRRFQEKHDLPATGMPDQETVRKLGLDPDAMFKAGEVSPTDGDVRAKKP